MFGVRVSESWYPTSRQPRSSATISSTFGAAAFAVGVEMSRAASAMIRVTGNLLHQPDARARATHSTRTWLALARASGWSTQHFLQERVRDLSVPDVAAVEAVAPQP